MADDTGRGVWKWVRPLIVVAVLGGLYVWLDEVVARRELPRFRPPQSTVTADPVAQQYVNALRFGRWDEAIGLTCWMQERLLRFQIETQDAAKRQAAREKLAARLRDRKAEGNVLRSEGVEDQYVFASNAAVTVIRVDAGRSDLERHVRSRTWFRVQYPAQHTALRNENGVPIRALTVGVNVSDEGYVLKAGVVGNLEIDWTSLSYQWE